MIIHYIKSIFGNYKKAGVVTVFNLLGLSVSFTAVILLSIYLWNEFTFDRQNEHLDQIYALSLISKEKGASEQQFTMPNPMADLILENIPELENLCSLAWGSNTYSKESDPSIGYTLNTRAVDSTFTDIFTVKIKSGTQSPLKGHKKIIISETAAKRIFGNEDPVGKVLLADFSTPYIVDAVFYDLPVNSSFQFEAFCSYPTNSWVNNWSEWSFRHYYKAIPNANIQSIEEKAMEIPAIKDLFVDYPDLKLSFSFVPLKELHFNKVAGSGNLIFSRTLIVVALLVLFMAFVNFINFAVANAPKMVRSVNMRRIVGESKSRLLFLSIMEAVVLMIISYVIAVLTCNVTLGIWQDIFGYEIILSDYTSLLLVCLISFIGLGAIAAIYPSVLITSVKPALALKGQLSESVKSWSLAKILTVIQYTISIILIIGILFIEKQIDYVKNYDLGFEKENILVLRTTDNIRNQKEAFTSELLKNPNISDYAFSQFVPGGIDMGWGREIDGKQVNYKCWPVDERYLNFMGFKIIEGRNFSSNIEADEDSFIFNRAAIEEFGWQESAIGKRVPTMDSTGVLIGIVDDIKFASLHENVQPMAFWLTKTRQYQLSLKINGLKTSETIDYINKVYDQFEDDYPIYYSFLDERLDALYRAEENQAQLIFIFCMVSILISVIGALGLIIFMCEFRVKEIGIRKVNGSSVLEIMLLLNKSFFRWILIAYVIAVPVSYYLVSSWLKGFAYQTNLSWWIFITAGFLTMIVSLMTVSWHSYRAASRNPVDAIRNE